MKELGIEVDEEEIEALKPPARRGRVEVQLAEMQFSSWGEVLEDLFIGYAARARQAAAKCSGALHSMSSSEIDSRRRGTATVQCALCGVRW